MDIYTLKERSITLSKKTETASITPVEVGGIMSDIIDLLQQLRTNGATLGIRKVYASTEALRADNNPVDKDGLPIKKGSLVSVFNPATDNPDNNKVFARVSAGWIEVGRLNAGTTNDYTNEDKEKVKILITNGSALQFLAADGKYHKIIIPQAPVQGVTVNGETVAPDAQGIVNIQTKQGTVQSVTINGTKKTPDEAGNITLETKQGTVQSVTINGTKKTPDQAGNVSIDIEEPKVKSISVNSTKVQPDSSGNVNIQMTTEVEETVNPHSNNPVASSAVAAEFSQLSKKYGASLALTESGEDGDKKYAISLLDESGEVLSTTEEFSAGGGSGGNVTTTKIVLTKISQNQTIKQGDSCALSFSYDHIDTTSGSSTGLTAQATILIIAGATTVEKKQTLYAGSTISLNVGDNLKVGNNTVRVRVVVENGETTQVSTISWNVNVITLSLSSSFDFATVINVGSTVAIPYYLTGSGLKRLMCYVNGVVADTKEINSSTSQGVFMVPTAGKSHGNMSVQLVAETDVTNGTVKSNSIYFDLVLQGGLSAPIIGARFDYHDGTIIGQGARPYLPAKQFENYEIKYAAYDRLNATKQVVVKVGGVAISTADVLFVQKSVINRSVVQGRIPATITTGGTTYSFDVVVSKADVELNEPTSNLIFKFDAGGKSNNDADKSMWLSSVNNVTATLTDVRYSGDGWTGEALKLTNKGRMTVNYQPLNVSNSATANSFVFQTRLKISSVVNDDAVLLSCVDNEGTGFLITATSAKMITRGKSEVSMALTADKLYNIAFVSHPVAKASSSDYEKLNTGMVYLYIDGVCAGGVQRDTTESIYQASPVNITAGSADATLELYGMRHYNGYLSDVEMLNLYIVDLADAELIAKKYMENDLLDGEGNITVDKVPDDMRYIIVTGVQANGVPTLLHAATINNKKAKYDVDEILHVKKSEPHLNFRLISGSMVIQGTSSLAYPVKNYKMFNYSSSKKPGKLYLAVDANGNGGTLSNTNKYSFKTVSDTGKKPAPVDCFCLKADYAESSSTHNTGLARLANKLLAEIAPTPPQKHVASSYEYDVRTTVDGEPCYLFYRKTVDDKPVFLGKYNLNNDKSTEDVFGFLNIPGYHDQDWVQSQFGGKNPTECWEFLNNDYPMGSFLDDDFDAKVVVDGKQIANWTRVFEARFPDDDAMNAKYANGEVKPQYLERFVKWVKSTKDNPAKFKAELKDYADVMHLCHYYNITDIFGAVDQRVKNSMMAFWYNPDVQKMLAYFIFYDNDTILGVRNDGRLKYKWDIDENSTDPELSVGGKTVYVYAGHDSVLWQNLRTQFKDELAESYKQIRQKLTNDEVFKMFDKLQSAKFAEIIYNKDAQIKYVAPKSLGVDVVQNGVLSKQHYSYLESLQGDRKPHRRWWLINRFHLFDAKYDTGNYTLTDLTWKGYSSAGAKIKATTNRDTYLQVRREGTVMTHDKVAKGQEWSYTYNNEANIGTIFHFYGGVFTEKLDLSEWGGFTDLNIPVLPALKELVLGSAGKSYNLTALSISTKLPMLEKLDIQNYVGIPTLDLTGCERLKSLNARGCSSMTSISIAEGAPIEQMVLPSALSTLTLRGLDINNGNISFPDGNGVKTLIVENCLNIDWEQLYTTLGGVTSLRVNNIKKTGDVVWLNKFKTLGGINQNGEHTPHCALVGTYQLTKYVEESEFEELQSQFPELNLIQPEYTTIKWFEKDYVSSGLFDVSDPANIQNVDNATGYGTSKAYKPSGHISKILSLRHRVLAKQENKGEMCYFPLHDDNSYFYADSKSISTASPAKLDGTEGDIFMYEPNYFYKGVNDYENGCCYGFFSANSTKPSSPEGMKITYNKLMKYGNVQPKKYIDVNGDTINECLKDTSSLAYSVAKVDVSGWKYINFIYAIDFSGNVYVKEKIAHVFVDSDGNVVKKFHVTHLDGNMGCSTVLRVPENAKYFYITYCYTYTTNEYDYIWLTNSDMPADWECEWVQHKENLVSITPINIIDGKPRCIVTPEQKQLTNFIEEESLNTILKVHSLQNVNYTQHKDISNLIFAAYGTRNTSIERFVGSAYGYVKYNNEGVGLYNLNHLAQFGMKDTDIYDEAKKKLNVPAWKFPRYSSIDEIAGEVETKSDHACILGYIDYPFISLFRKDFLQKIETNSAYIEGNAYLYYVFCGPKENGRGVPSPNGDFKYIKNISYGRHMDITPKSMDVGTSGKYFSTNFKRSLGGHIWFNGEVDGFYGVTSFNRRDGYTKVLTYTLVMFDGKLKQMLSVEDFKKVQQYKFLQRQ